MSAPARNFRSPALERGVEAWRNTTLASACGPATMKVFWLGELPQETLGEVEALLDRAYEGAPSMGEHFRANLLKRREILVFTLENEDSPGRVLATRSVGEAPWGEEYWGEHARSLGQPIPVAGQCLAVAGEFRGRGLGALIWKASTAWIKDHADLKAVFGDTVSRKALEMYNGLGAWFVAEDIARLLAHYGATSLGAFFRETADLERVPHDLGVRYAWPLKPPAKEVLAGFGYAPFSPDP